jgi:hypothetical protein
MGFELRNNMIHVGDKFVGVVQKTADIAIQCSKSVFLTYDIKALQSKRLRASREIGERVTLLMHEGTTDITRDATLQELIASLNSIEKGITQYENERLNLKIPLKVKNTACVSTINNRDDTCD